MIDVKEKLRLYERLKSDRSQWDSHWQEVSDLVLPTREFAYTYTTPGIKRHNKIFDGTAPLACSQSAAALHGLLCNPAIWWVHVGLQDQDDDLDEVGKAWLFDTSMRCLRYFSSVRSGFATHSHEVFLDEMAFGTGICLMRERDGWLTFQARQLSNFYLCENDAGEITDEIVCMKIRAKDLPSVLDMEPSAFSSETQKKIASTDAKSYESLVEVVHCVGKRDEYDPTMYGAKNMPWYSAYIEVEAKHLIDEGGLRSNPYLTPRWSKAPMETYGRSPAMDVLPAIKAINAIKKELLIAAQLNTSPPINVPANGMEGPFKYLPRAINYMRQGTKERPEPMVTSVVGIKDGLEMMEMDRREIEGAYFLDVLKLPAPGEQQRMTAEEVISRRQQGLLLTSGALSRQESEFLDPAVTTVFNFMKRTGRLLPAPPSILGKPLKPYYKNPMAIAQRSSESQNFLQAMQTSNGLLAIDPGVMPRNMDSDFAFRSIFEMFNTNPRFMRKISDTKKIVAQEQQQKAAAAQVSIAQGGAAAAKDAAQGLAAIGNQG